MKSTDVENITSTTNTILLCLEIPIAKFWEECYDGASTMAGACNGIAGKIQQLEPKAVFIAKRLVFGW